MSALGPEPDLVELHNVMRGEIRRAEPLARHTTLRIGGPADYFLLPADEAALQAAVLWARRGGLPVYWLGLGSNLLVPDEGVRGAIVTLNPACSWVRFEAGTRVEVGAGYSVMRLLNEAAERGLAGLEGLAGVPGTVGGALAMNAGSAVGDIGRVTRSVRVLAPGGELEDWPVSALEFGYRRSRLQDGSAVALAAVLELRAGEREAIRGHIAENLTRRKRTQPIELPNAGSIWTNPPEEFAGQLIEACGCKGWRVGDAQVSVKHANFIVNLGRARAADVIALMARTRRAVEERFGVRLEPELRWLRGQQELGALLDQASP